MGLRGRDSDIVKKVSITMEKKHVVVQREDELLARPISARSHAESLRSQAKKIDHKVNPVSPRLLIEEDVVDRDDCMWLSSGCVSPSAFFQEHRLSTPFNHVADDWLVSRLSTLADTYVSLSKSSGKSLEGGESTSESNNKEYMEDLSGGDEPLFWPFDKKTDWNSNETWNYFSMSPRKDIIINVTNPEANMSGKNLVLNSKILELKQGSKGCNNRNSSRRVVNENIRPSISRLRESRKNSAKIVPLDLDSQILPFLEDDDFIRSNEQLPIETVLGLGEFDGHEGIDSEFNQDVFLLHL